MAGIRDTNSDTNVGGANIPERPSACADIAVAIVNYNTRDLLLGCIRSIHATTKRHAFRILVADNASGDGSVAAVRAEFPEVEIVEHDENLGFGRAVNGLMANVTEPFAVILNTDTVLCEGALDGLADFLGEHPRCAVACGQLLNADGSLQTSFTIAPSLVTELLNKALLRLCFPTRYTTKLGPDEGPRQVETVIGACMVVRSEAVRRVGGLDERFFFFLEETDWCVRFRREGWQIWCVPSSRIYHLKGASAGAFGRRARIEYASSRRKFFRKHYRLARTVMLDIGVFLRAVLSMAGLAVPALFSGRARERLRYYARLALWHLAGFPDGWGMRPGTPARQTGEPVEKS